MIFSDHLHEVASRTSDLCAPHMLQFYIIYKCTNWNISERHPVALLHFYIWPSQKLITNLHASWQKHIPLFSIFINRKADKPRTIWIILHRSYFVRNTDFVVSKINLSEKSLVATTLVPDRDPTNIVSTYWSLT